MTTQVAVMNLDGVAVASDTLVSFGQKSLDGARKIYELGDGHQVLVVHSGNASISGTSQYLHFVEWTKTLGEPLSALDDYVKSYLAWSNQEHPVITPAGESRLVHQLLNDHYYWMKNEVMTPRLREAWENSDEPLSAEREHQITDSAVIEGGTYLNDLPDYPDLGVGFGADLIKRLEINLDEKLDYIFDGIPLSKSSRGNLKLQAGQVLTKEQEMEDTDSKIAFVGFGGDEPYAGVIRVAMRGVLSGKVFASVDAKAAVAPDSRAYVQYFAQSDAMFTMVEGQHWRIRNNYQNIIWNALKSRLPDAPEEEIDAITESIGEQNAAFIQQEFVGPFINTIAAMGLGKLADLANSLIAVQMMSNHGKTERPTIGGFVEVAIIDRQHGVRWVRKLADDVLPSA